MVGLATAKRSGRSEVQSDSEQSLEFERHRRAYDDWISREAITPRQREPTVAIETLEDLVDIAIDGDSRVIEDVESNDYYVLTSNVVYAFRAPDGGNENA